MIRILLLAAMISTVSASAIAASHCGPRKAIIETLAKNFEEHPIAIGLSHNGRLLEILARKDGRTWTVIATSPEGITCVLDTGEEWRFEQTAHLGPKV